MEWIIQNASTIIISLILLVIVGLIIYNMIKKKRSGQSTCGCGCADCAMRSACHKQAESVKQDIQKSSTGSY